MIFNSLILLFVCVVFHSCTLLQAIEGQRKVKSTLYYESLCPGCHMFITNQLVPTWNSMSEYMNIEFVPYGNAERKFIDGHWKFACQHGKPECAENLVHACAVKLLQDKEQAKLLEFLNCMVTQRADTLDDKTKMCVKKVDVDFDTIESCITSPNAEQLILSMAKKTESVKPELTQVPTVQIDGVYNPDEDEEIAENFKGVICKHLGDPQPEICNEVW